MQKLRTLRAVACVAALVMLGMHLGSGRYAVHINFGSALKISCHLGACEVTVVREDFWGTPTKLMAPHVVFATWETCHAVDVGWLSWDLMYDRRSMILRFPIWAWAGPFLTLAAVCTFYQRRHRVRTADPICRVCGYNLRGNRSGRCPECGTPVATLAQGEAKE